MSERIILLEEIAKTAEIMREAQISYFADRDKSVLVESKQLEKKLDGLLRKLKVTNASPNTTPGKIGMEG